MENYKEADTRLEDEKSYEQEEEKYEKVASDLESIIDSHNPMYYRIEHDSFLLKQAKDIPTDFEHEGRLVLADVYVVRSLTLGEADGDHRHTEEIADGVYLDESTQEIESIPNAMGIEFRIAGSMHSGMEVHIQGVNWSISHGLAGEPALDQITDMSKYIQRPIATRVPASQYL